MSCSGICRFTPFGSNSCGLVQLEPWCCIQIALNIVAFSGVALLFAAIVSYLPPVAGYVGGGAFACAVMILAIGNCCEERRNAPNSLADPEKKQAKISPMKFEPAHITPSALVIPNVLYLLILQYLGGNDLVAASQVCHQWRHVAADNSLWERLCLQERICPLEHKLAPIPSYQCLYSVTQIWRGRIETGIPREQRIALPNQPESTNFQSILKIDDYYFVHSCNSQNVNIPQFEVWDASFKHLLCKASLPCLDSFTDIRFKKISDVGYLFGWSRSITDREREKKSLSDIYVLRIDLNTFQAMPYLSFPQQHRAHSHFKPPFEITKDKAFVGHENGEIYIWDLFCRGPSHLRPTGTYFSFEDRVWWNEESKKNLLTTRGQIDDSWQFAQDYQRIIDQQKRLVGHSKAITALLIADDYLFSCSLDSTIRHWDLKTYRCLRIFEMGLGEQITQLKIAGRYLFGLIKGGDDKKIIAQWDFHTGECLLHQALEKKYHTFCIVGNLIVFAYAQNANKIIDILDLSSQVCLQSLTVPYSTSLNEYAMQIVNNSIYATGVNMLHTWNYSSPNKESLQL